MKITKLANAALALLMAIPAVAQVKNPSEIKTPPLRQVKLQQPKRVVLPNGMVLLLMEDHELPLISGTARIRGGARDVPVEKTGLAGILGQAWRTGGTKSRTGDQLDEFLEARAAVVETGASDASTSISLNVLKQDFDTVLPIFIELLREPEFRQEKIDLARTQVNTAISRRNDEPGGIATRESTKLGYGSDSPYARQAEYATVASITRDDLLAFHRKYVHPNNIVFGLVGDFNTSQMEQKLRKAFGSWSKGPQAPAPVMSGTPAKPGIYFVSKDDVNQSNISMVHAGIQRDNPDYAALQVLNEILSSERLFPHIRTQQGLAYAVSGSVGSDFDHPGLFRATVGTKSGTTVQAINSLRTELQALHSTPFTAEELSRSKQTILNAHVFTIDSKAKVLAQSMNLEFYGYPSDWYSKYPSLVEKVTAEDVARVAKKYVTPDQVALLVVGNPKEFDQQLSTLGTVNTIDVTIPEPGGSKPSASSAPATGHAEGTALVSKMTQFAGGKANIDKIQSIRLAQDSSNKTPQGQMDVEMEQLIVYPDRVRATMRMPMGEVTMVITPDTAFANLPGMGVRDLPSSQRDGIKGQVRSDILTILKYPEKYTIAVTGTEKVGSVDAKVLEVTAEGDTTKFVVDPASGKVLRKISRSRNPMMQGEIVTEYTEWKTFGGVQFPTAATSSNNGEQVGTTTVKSIEINPAVDAATWVKPAA